MRKSEIYFTLSPCFSFSSENLCCEVKIVSREYQGRCKNGVNMCVKYFACSECLLQSFRIEKRLLWHPLWTPETLSIVTPEIFLTSSVFALCYVRTKTQRSLIMKKWDFIKWSLIHASFNSDFKLVSSLRSILGQPRSWQRPSQS